MTTFVRGSNPIWLFDNLVGQILDDTYYIFILQNTLPYLPATNVYQDPEGNVQWSNPIQFLANGTLPDNIYFTPDFVYRLEVRAGNTQAAALIYLIENYVPNSGGESPITTIGISSDNELTNPQFQTTVFTSPLVSTANLNAIGEGWMLLTSGTGTITVNQIAIPGNTNIPSNPPFVLQINNAGFDTVTLYQRFQGNGALFANDAAAMSFVANAPGGIPVTISGYLQYSDTTIAPIISKTLTTAYQEFSSASTIPASTNPDTSPSAYTDVIVTWASQGIVNITSIQIIGQDVPVPLTFAQDTLERQTDYAFHYYFPQLEFKPIPSYTIGWDFPFNPSQFYGSNIAAVNIGNNISRYIADQTIAFEEVANSLSYSITDVGLTIMTANDSQLAIIQYLDQSTARELLKNYISLMLSGSATPGTVQGNITLYYTTGALPDLNSNNSLVTSMTNGVPTVAAGWTKITRPAGYGDATFTLNTTGTNFPLDSFNSASGIPAATTATYFAVVIGFKKILSTQQISLLFCSMNRGQIPTPPAPLSKSETLSALQYYFEQTFPVGSMPVSYPYFTNARTSLQNAVVSAGSISIFPLPIEIIYTVEKRVTPSVTLISPQSGSSGTVLGIPYNNAAAIGTGTDLGVGSVWNPEAAGTKSVNYKVLTASGQATVGGAGGTANPFGLGWYHAYFDARLGLV